VCSSRHLDGRRSSKNSLKADHGLWMPNSNRRMPWNLLALKCYAPLAGQLGGINVPESRIEAVGGKDSCSSTPRFAGKRGGGGGRRGLTRARMDERDARAAL